MYLNGDFLADEKSVGTLQTDGYMTLTTMFHILGGAKVWENGEFRPATRNEIKAVETALGKWVLEDRWYKQPVADHTTPFFLVPLEKATEKFMEACDIKLKFAHLKISQRVKGTLDAVNWEEFNSKLGKNRPQSALNVIVNGTVEKKSQIKMTERLIEYTIGNDCGKRDNGILREIMNGKDYPRCVKYAAIATAKKITTTGKQAVAKIQQA